MHKINPEIPHRYSVRLKNYDYSQAGAYFVTLVTYQRKRFFGEIQNGSMILNPYGKIVRGCWEKIPQHFPHIELKSFVVMPNHLHGIISIKDNDFKGTACRAATDENLQSEAFGKPVKGSLPTIIRSYKSAATKAMNDVGARHAVPAVNGFQPFWQKNYFEHIIRTEIELFHLSEYIIENPSRWEMDDEYYA